MLTLGYIGILLPCGYICKNAIFFRPLQKINSNTR